MALIVSDSSVLIHLSGINRFDLLKENYQHIIISPVVKSEVVDQGRNRPGAIEVKKAIDEGWIKIIEAKNKTLSQILKQNLHEGEAESIALAIENPDSLLLIDESEARKTARLYNLKITGVIGVLIKAKIQGKISSLKNELDKLRNSGFWISDNVYKKAANSVGE